MATVLISGGSGLIGRRVIEAWGEGGSDDVIALGRADADLLVPGAWTKIFDEHQPDVVVHLAWSASALPDYRDHDDNWRWTDSTIEGAVLALDRGIHFLATGTSVDESPASDVYSRSKAAAREALAPQIAAGELGWLRPFYVFDEGRPSPAILRAAFAAKSLSGPVHLANPDAQHDFIHACDVGTAIRTVVSSRLSGAIDLGSGSLTSVAQLVEAYGCNWVAAGDSSIAASTAAIADIAQLSAAGWKPVATQSRLGSQQS